MAPPAAQPHAVALPLTRAALVLFRGMLSPARRPALCCPLWQSRTPDPWSAPKGRGHICLAHRPPRVRPVCGITTTRSFPPLCVLMKGRGCPAWQTRDVRWAPAFTEPLASTPGGIGALRTEPATDLSCRLLRTVHTVGFSPSTSIFTYRTDALGTAPVVPSLALHDCTNPANTAANVYSALTAYQALFKGPHTERFIRQSSRPREVVRI